uniref:Calmodulin-binding protein-like n=1 Tax=Oryza rufipogon TaxID=4529 RepID=A0A0E0P209_ORYRU
MSRKRERPLEVVAPPATPLSPSKRLRRAGLVVMWLRRKPKPVGVEQMAARLIRQMQVQMVKLFMLLMFLVARLGNVERLLLEQPYLIRRLLEEHFGIFQRSLMESIQDTVRKAVHSEASILDLIHMKERQTTLLSGGAYQHPRPNISEGFPQTGGSTRMVKLFFVDVERPEDPLFTGSPVQWQNGANAKVAIFENGSQITQGGLSKLQIEILPVHDDFFTERGPANFTKEEFNKQIYMCKGKESVLKTVNLTNGEANLGSFFFTESSHGKRLRLAARVKYQDLAVRVQEATSYSFVVKDRRSKLNKKSNSPSKEEGIHCLKKISLKGKRCNDLAGKYITKVKHLMRCYHRDPAGLQKLTGMKNEDWNTMISHATTSDPGDEIHSYRVEKNTIIFFNDFFALVGMSVDGSYAPYHANNLNQLQQRKMNKWKESAYQKFEELEKLGCLIPDHVMINGQPVPVSPKNDASHSIQANPTSFNHQIALEESGREGPSMQHNGTSYSLTEENILNGLGSGLVQSTILSQNTAVVPGADPRHSGYASTSTADAAGTSCPVTDGVGPWDYPIFSDLYPNVMFQEPSGLIYGHVVEADQAFLPDSHELANADNQFTGGNDDSAPFD